MADSIEKAAIEQELSEIPGKIEAKALEVREARKTYKIAKATYENKVAEVLLKEKLMNPDATQTDVKATATVASIELRFKMIEMQSQYEAKQAEYQRLRDDLTALEQRSNNYRAELKALRG